MTYFAKVNIYDYIESLNNNELCLGDILPNNQITINEEEIIVSKGIITNNYLNQENKEFHPTKDLGFVKDNKIYIAEYVPFVF